MAIKNEKSIILYVAQYNASKTADKINSNDLYFLTDTKQICIGEDLYTDSLDFVAEFPACPSQGVINCNPTTHEKVWNGSAWKVIIPAAVSTIGESLPGGNLSDVTTIKGYVAC